MYNLIQNEQLETNKYLILYGGILGTILSFFSLVVGLMYYFTHANQNTDLCELSGWTNHTSQPSQPNQPNQPSQPYQTVDVDQQIHPNKADKIDKVDKVDNVNETNFKFKYEYLKKYIDWVEHQKYSLSREIIQEKIIDSHFIGKNKQTKKRIIFTGGCYGAGKSNVLKQLQKENKINLNDYVCVDQDKMRDQIPEYETYLKENYYTAGFRTNKETGYMSEIIQLHALSNGYNLIVDSSLRHTEWLTQYFNLIRTEFPEYEIYIIFVTASWERILERNIRRGEITRRVIPLDCLAETFKQSPISFEILKQHVDKWYVIENDYKENELNYETLRSKQFISIDLN